MNRQNIIKRLIISIIIGGIIKFGGNTSWGTFFVIFATGAGFLLTSKNPWIHYPLKILGTTGLFILIFLRGLPRYKQPIDTTKFVEQQATYLFTILQDTDKTLIANQSKLNIETPSKIIQQGNILEAPNSLALTTGDVTIAFLSLSRQPLNSKIILQSPQGEYLIINNQTILKITITTGGLTNIKLKQGSTTSGSNEPELIKNLQTNYENNKHSFLLQQQGGTRLTIPSIDRAIQLGLRLGNKLESKRYKVYQQTYNILNPNTYNIKSRTSQEQQKFNTTTLQQAKDSRQETNIQKTIQTIKQRFY